MRIILIIKSVRLDRIKSIILLMKFIFLVEKININSRKKADGAKQGGIRSIEIFLKTIILP
jgi:hypothetical protein